MVIRRRMRSVILLLPLLLTAGAGVASAQQPFSYAGRTVTVAIGSGASGSHAQYARLIARHMGRYLPGQPTVVAKYYPGAGGMTLANQLLTQTPRDGTTIALINRTIYLEPLINGGKAVGKFDPRKLSWIGSADSIVGVAIAWHTSKVKTWKDLLEHELIVAAVGAASGTTKEAYLLRNLFGFKFRVIMGYLAGGDVDLAMERGEVEGRANLAWQGLKNRDLKHVQEGRIRMLYQMALARHKELPDLPLVMDFARNAHERQILTLNFAVNEVGYSFVAPPGVPPEQLAMLRTAFKRALEDPKLIAEAHKQRLDINYIPPERLQAIFDELYGAPPDLIAEWLRLTQPNAPEEKARVQTVKATLAAVGSGARSIAFNVGNTQHQARIDRRQTAITIGGNKVAPDALKAGLTCSISYFGNKGTATSIACN
ncbi:MAG: Bug family tripartite tricarboxylate transporter substrate binding protein [Xanthobacteraceae bacterium]